MSDVWDRLVPRLQELHDLSSAARLLSWDQAVMMPPAGAAGRARAMATLEAFAHARLVDAEIGDLLAELADDTSLDAVQTASVRNLKRSFDKATRLPETLVRALAETQGLAYHAWTEARPAGDFALLRPHLERMVELKKEEADALGYPEERYDALIDLHEPDATTAEVEAMFDGLVAGLKPIADAVLDVAGGPPLFPSAAYEVAPQKAFCDWLVEQIGFDGRRGRLDTSPHPFTMAVGPGDVRQTTRTEANGLLFSIYAALHESGHALYEQNIPEELADLPAGGAPSLGLHESQSRLWENHVGRGRAFSEFMLPHLKERFPQLGNLTPDEFYRGVNHPRRTLIRVSADELTYNLHVALRFELELSLFRDRLAVADLPDAWNEAMERHIGVRPEGDADGVLQDMHWSIGALGYFPTYTMGTLYAAMFYARIEHDVPDLARDLRKGDTTRLLGWLRDEVHSQAHLYPGKELVRRVLGSDLRADAFLAYVRRKYGELFDIDI